MKLPTAAMFLWLVAGRATLSWAADVICGEGDEQIICQNGSICIDDRPPDFSEYELEGGSYHNVHITELDFHCRCRDGWTGVDCAVPVESCADGKHFCLHGGDCVEDTTWNELYCDCSGAYDEDEFGRITRYVGKWCEHPEPKSGHCDDESFTFCLNGGTCNARYPEDSDDPCDCPAEYYGPHCEYSKEYELPDCTLDCENGGVCKLGDGDPYDPDDPDYIPNDYFDYFEVGESDDEPFMYCDCPDGTHGEFCEVTSVQCGDDRCYHGSECVSRESNGETFYHCNCNTAGDDSVRYAGRFCQYESTEFCTSSSESLQGQLFCVNGGTCQSDAYLGCKCPEGYAGFSCEFRIDEDYVDTKGETLAPPGFDELESKICDLNCNGHGTCRKGMKDTSSLGNATHGSALNQTHTDDFEHCVCMEGYVGLQCEHAVKICGENDDNPDHFCLHGGTCLEDGEAGFRCDCSTARSDLGDLFTGEHCQNPIEVESKSRSGRKVARIFVLVIIVLSFVIFGATKAYQHLNRRSYFKETGVDAGWSATSYSDMPDQSKNLAPRGEGNRLPSSSRDPMAEFANVSSDEEDDPMMFLGPPQDEDGNQLDSVSII